MCTVSWLGGVGLVELFTNRDEQRSRPAAERPSEWVTPNGTRFLAPRDPLGGGSWVAANEHGVALCLVNHYQAAEPGGSSLLSRGTVIVDLADGRDLGQVESLATELELERLRGFRVLALHPEESPLLFSWDGAEAACERGSMVAPPLISSSVTLPEVEVARRAAYRVAVEEHGGETSAALQAFHASRSPEPGPLAVAMSRQDACTVSHTRVRIDTDTVEMEYAEGPPGNGVVGSIHSLARCHHDLQR